MSNTFWSYSEMGAMALYEHRDIYSDDGGLAPAGVERREVGAGPGGFVF